MTTTAETMRSRNHDECVRMLLEAKSHLGRGDHSTEQRQVSGRVQVCEHTGWLTNDDETASIFGDTWVAPESCKVKIGRAPPKVAEALLVALRRWHSAWEDATYNVLRRRLRLACA